MNLTEIRLKFRELSGRFDLVNSDGSDNGADFYLNAGQRLLDLLVDSPKTESWYIPDSKLTVGDYKIQMKHARSIREVWFSDSSSRFEVERKSLYWILSNYNLESGDNGQPLYYAPIPVSLAPELFMKSELDYSSGEVQGYGVVEFDAPYEYTGLLFAPAADDMYSVKIRGRFFSQPLEAFTVPYDTTRANDTEYTIGVRAKWSSGVSVWQVQTAGTSDSGAPDITDLVAGDTVTDGTVVWLCLSTTANVDTSSYWTLNMPEAVVFAALTRLEESYRNREGARDWLEALSSIISGVDADVMNLEAGQSTQMESNW